MKSLMILGIVAVLFAAACSSPEPQVTEPVQDASETGVQDATAEPSPAQIEQELDTSDLDEIGADLDSAILE